MVMHLTVNQASERHPLVRSQPLEPNNSPVAQSVERTAVNRYVAGSNPARGAKFTCHVY